MKNITADFENSEKVKNATLPDLKKTLDQLFVQETIKLKPGCKIVFVNDINKLDIVENYADLKLLKLSENDEKFVNANWEKVIKSNPSAYDGEHLLITQALYDEAKNIIYQEALAASYRVLSAIAAKDLPSNSELKTLKLYKTGVLVPVITRDGYTTFMQRNDAYKLWSVNGGFCQPVNGIINGLPNHGLNLYEQTALIELIEELLGFKSQHARFEHFMNVVNQSQGILSEVNKFSSFKISTLPMVTSVSIRCIPGHQGASTIDYIAPVKLECTKTQLDELLNKTAQHQFKLQLENLLKFTPINDLKAKFKELALNYEFSAADKMRLEKLLEIENSEFKTKLEEVIRSTKKDDVAKDAKEHTGVYKVGSISQFSEFNRLELPGTEFLIKPIQDGITEFLKRDQDLLLLAEITNPNVIFKQEELVNQM